MPMRLPSCRFQQLIQLDWILFVWLSLFAYLSWGSPLEALAANAITHPEQSGVRVLEKGEESLLARAWLTEKPSLLSMCSTLYGALTTSVRLPVRRFCAQRTGESRLRLLWMI